MVVRIIYVQEDHAGDAFMSLCVACEVLVRLCGPCVSTDCHMCSKEAGRAVEAVPLTWQLPQIMCSLAPEDDPPKLSRGAWLPGGWLYPHGHACGAFTECVRAAWRPKAEILSTSEII